MWPLLLNLDSARGPSELFWFARTGQCAVTAGPRRGGTEPTAMSRGPGDGRRLYIPPTGGDRTSWSTRLSEPLGKEARRPIPPKRWTGAEPARHEIGENREPQ